MLAEELVITTPAILLAYMVQLKLCAAPHPPSPARYKGHSRNTLQNDIILLIFKTRKLGNIHSVGNLIGGHVMAFL